MGDSEDVGNLSVYWSVDHEDGNDLRVEQGNPNRPKANDRNNVHTKRLALGRDGKAVRDVRGKHHKSKPGYFGVRLRFDNEDEAKAAVQEALENPLPVPGGFYIEVNVKAIKRKDPDDQPRAEVKVEW